MKKNLRQGIFMLFAFLSIHSNASATRILDLPFDGNYTDQSGSTNTIVEQKSTGSPGITYITDRLGQSNSAAYFSGNHFLNIVSSSNFNNLSTYTISFFAKPDQVTSTEQIAISKITPGRDYVFEFDRYGRWRSNHTETGVGGLKFVTNPTASSTSEWVHVAYVSTPSIVKLYVDGQLVASRSTLGTPNGTGGNMTIGAFGNGILHYKGAIDNLTIDDEELTPTELEEAASSLTLLKLTFDGNIIDEAQVPNTISQRINPGSNGITYITDRFGNPNSAGYFDGNYNINVHIDNDGDGVADSKLNTMSTYTISFFAKPNSNNSASRVILSKISPGRDFVFDYKYGRWYTHHMQEGVSGLVYVNNPSTSIPNEWEHVAYVCSGSQIDLYVGGQLVASKTTIGTPRNEGLLMSIGSFQSSASRYQGGIDDLIITRKLLSSTEIANIANGSLQLKKETSTALTQDLNTVKIYPNPSAGNFTVDVDPAQVKTIKVVSAQGSIVYEKEVTETVQFGESFTPGVYYVTLTASDNTTKTYKVVKI